jgi:hypothetical protein
LPFVQGRLAGRELTAVIETACAHCSQPMRIEVTSSLAFRATTPGADLKDPSIIHAF